LGSLLSPVHVVPPQFGASHHQFLIAALDAGRALYPFPYSILPHPILSAFGGLAPMGRPTSPSTCPVPMRDRNPLRNPKGAPGCMVMRVRPQCWGPADATCWVLAPSRLPGGHPRSLMRSSTVEPS
jgi:hypothetical protein